LANVVGVYLVQVSLLLIGQQGLGHFFRYQPLLPIGWRTPTPEETPPTTLSAIQAASQSTFSMLSTYTSLVISMNVKNKQPTLLSQHKLVLDKLVLDVRNTLFAL
jgi:hypothetical protein